MDIQSISQINGIKRPKKIRSDDSQKKKQPATQKPSSHTQQDEEPDVQHIDEHV